MSQPTNKIDRGIMYNELMDFSTGDTVDVHHHVERDYNSARKITELYTSEEDAEYKRAPSYSVNNDTTYYIGCGIITAVFKNTCNVRYGLK